MTGILSFQDYIARFLFENGSQRFRNINTNKKINEPLLIESQKGKSIIQYNGYRYRRKYRTKKGVRWNCSVKKDCTAFLCLDDENDIIMANEHHHHSAAKDDDDNEDDVVENSNSNSSAMVITSRKGKEMLLYRQYTYRRHYHKGNKLRWVCSTLKNCNASVFTDVDNNVITMGTVYHNHNPPKYYLQPDHVIKALREKIIIEAD